MPHDDRQYSPISLFHPGRHLPGPQAMLVQGWGWLTAETGDLAEKKRAGERLSTLDPSAEWARAALAGGADGRGGTRDPQLRELRYSLPPYGDGPGRMGQWVLR
jgi:hypothetical protein